MIAACDGQQFREKMLITHRGLSGPAILQISSYWKTSRDIKIDLAPGSELDRDLPRREDSADSGRSANRVPQDTSGALRGSLARA